MSTPGKRKSLVDDCRKCLTIQTVCRIKLCSAISWNHRILDCQGLKTSLLQHVFITSLNCLDKSCL